MEELTPDSRILRPVPRLALCGEFSAGKSSIVNLLLGCDMLPTAVRDADVVIHCAAKLGDWGPVDDYRNVNVECLRVLRVDLLNAFNQDNYGVPINSINSAFYGQNTNNWGNRSLTLGAKYTF